MLSYTTILLRLTFAGDIISCNRSFSTNITSTCHDYFHLILSIQLYGRFVVTFIIKMSSMIDMATNHKSATHETLSDYQEYVNSLQRLNYEKNAITLLAFPTAFLLQ